MRPHCASSTDQRRAYARSVAYETARDAAVSGEPASGRLFGGRNSHLLAFGASRRRVALRQRLRPPAGCARLPISYCDGACDFASSGILHWQTRLSWSVEHESQRVRLDASRFGTRLSALKIGLARISNDIRTGSTSQQPSRSSGSHQPDGTVRPDHHGLSIQSGQRADGMSAISLWSRST